MSPLRRFRDALLSVALLAVPFFFLSANLKDPSQVGFIDRLVLQASAPIQYLATEVARGASSIIEDYVYLVEVRKESERLQRENARLREEAHRLADASQENRRLRELLDLRDRLRTETLSALVIGKEVSPLFRVTRVRLDRGERDQLKPGMPVVSSQGLVGQVRRAWGRYSDILLTVDRTSAVDVIVQRTGARGILRGTGESNRYLCRIQYLQRDDQIQVGDLVHTSGLGQRFPAGILVGRVSRVRKQDVGLYQEAEVAPAVDFSTLEEVLVLLAGPREAGVLEPPSARSGGSSQ